MAQFADTLTIDSARRTADGYLRVVAKGARVGIQKYLGREVDPSGKTFAADQIVNVYRPPAEVFDKASLASSVGRPITDDHPTVPVTADNWRDHSRGAIGGAVKDGEWVRFDLAFMDAGLIGKVDAGKVELSGGYACDVSFESGTTDDGQAFDAVQRNIRFNHLAVVDKARAGPEARIGDAKSDGGNEFAACDALPHLIDHLKGKRSMNFIMLDGLKVDLDDGDAVKALVTKLQTQVTDATTAKDSAEAKVATLTTEKATLDAKIVTLEQQVKDSAITPAKLRDAAKVYADAAAKAKALGVTVTDEMGEADIQKAVVTAKLGDAAKDWTPEMVSVSFATMTADTKIEPKHDPIHAPKAMTTDNASVRDFVRAAQY